MKIIFYLTKCNFKDERIYIIHIIELCIFATIIIYQNIRVNLFRKAMSRYISRLLNIVYLKHTIRKIEFKFHTFFHDNIRKILPFPTSKGNYTVTDFFINNETLYRVGHKDFLHFLGYFFKFLIS